MGAADEADWQPLPADKPQRVVVVGGGIAGMEAAWVAASRGHDVTLFSSSDEPGGKTRLHALLPGGENLSSIYDYQRLSGERAGVRFQWGYKADAADILALEPDHVVLATGSTPIWPDYLPEEYRGEGFFPDLREAMEQVTRFSSLQPGTAVIHDADGGAFTYAAAELLSDRFEHVVVLTERERLASDEAVVTRQGIYARLYRKGVEIMTSVRPLASSRFEEAEVAYANIYNGREGVITDVALFTYASARRPNDELAPILTSAGLNFHLIGDAWAPRSVLTATADGYRIAMEI